MRVLIAGSNGMIGSAVTRHLVARGFDVVRLVRRSPNSGEIFWDPERGLIDQAALEGFEGVIHLATRPWPLRWSKSAKEKMRINRLATNSLLSNALANCRRKPRVFIAASGMGIYPPSSDAILTEENRPGLSFLANLQSKGEAATTIAHFAGIRVINLRIPMVLGGSALKQIGFQAGDGRQWTSWVGRDELASIIEFALTHDELSGPVNAVSPNPLRNAEFAKVASEVLDQKFSSVMPAFFVRLLMGEMGDELILSSRRLKPARLLAAGYPFRFPTLAEAIRHEVKLADAPVALNQKCCTFNSVTE